MFNKRQNKKYFFGAEFTSYYEAFLAACPVSLAGSHSCTFYSLFSKQKAQNYPKAFSPGETAVVSRHYPKVFSLGAE